MAHEEARRTRRLRIGVGGLIVLAIAAGVFLFLTSDDGDDVVTETDADTVATEDDLAAVPEAEVDPGDAFVGPEGCPAVDGSSPRTIDFTEAHPMCIDPEQTHIAIFDTSEGEVRVRLDASATPGTVNNFVTLARWGYYDGTTIFRTDPGIDIIQGGAPHNESPSDPGPGYTIDDEPQFQQSADGRLTGPYRYVPGQLVMARTGAPNSSSAQFFFTTGVNASLLDSQGVYVVFGTTDEPGLGVLQDIIALHEPGGRLGGAPSRTVTINSVTIQVS